MPEKTWLLFTGAALACLLCVALWMPGEARGEWYVAGQFGGTFADRLSNIEGTDRLVTVQPRTPDFDLKNSLLYGAKVGYFPGNGWFGIEGEAFNTTPHIKNLSEVPGTHLRVTTVAINFIARYPHPTVQPYAGIGVGWIFSGISESGTQVSQVPTRSDTDVSSALNLLAGVRFFLTPYVAMFTEYKYTESTFRFDRAFGPVGGFAGDYTAQHVVLGLSYHF
jgi:opacity protein-like surface antigen